MSLAPSSFDAIPEETIRVAQAAFPYSTRLMQMRDHLGAIYIGVGKGSRPPRPPNRAGGSPAHGSPVGSFLIGIGVPAHKLQGECKAPGQQRTHAASADDPSGYDSSSDV